MDDRAKAVEISRVDGVIRCTDAGPLGQIHFDADNGVTWSPGVSASEISRLGLKTGDRGVLRTTLEVVRPEPAVGPKRLYLVDPPFKAGDVVRAKDGPPMTVNGTNGSKAECVWFEGVYLHWGLFSLGDLTRVGAETTKNLPIDPFAKDWQEPRGAIVTANGVGPEPAASSEPEGRKINFREWT